LEEYLIENCLFNSLQSLFYNLEDMCCSSY